MKKLSIEIKNGREVKKIVKPLLIDLYLAMLCFSQSPTDGVVL
jgi:hypothetical protein